MEKNVGKTDTIVRIILAIVILTLGIYYRSWWGALAVIPLFTAFIHWCPLYIPFHIKTVKRENKQFH